jgi:2-polyprenyl-3-methyl-5-hydroxy-6-metoxy-1,4-benzoquinol methylase
MGKLRLPLRSFRRLWVHYMGTNTRYSDDNGRFDRMYLLRDPWKMGSPAEQFRLAETNRIIREQFGITRTLLEVGCGEGHQTAFLKRVSENVTGLDVSKRAVRRARKNCPGATFNVGDIFSLCAAGDPPYELVVCCEVLYYIVDVASALRKMLQLGSSVLVTYFEGEMANLDPIVLAVPGCKSDFIECASGRWRVAWFKAR